jgi:hypothetical protein
LASGRRRAIWRRFFAEGLGDRAEGHPFRDECRIRLRFFDRREILARRVFRELDEADLVIAKVA